MRNWNDSLSCSAVARKSCGATFDVPRLESELPALDLKLHQPDLWSDPENAQRLLQRRKHLERQVEAARAFGRDLKIGRAHV